MSNPERDPQEQLLTQRIHTPQGVSPGIHDGVNGVSLLVPRQVPLGGPRAMNVRRTLPQRARSLVGAWCFLDFYGPDRVSKSGGMRVPRHPHTGLATVSWLFTGRVDHIDSAGNWATVRPGDAVFMNAGRGITHSEHSTADTTVLHGAQLWYAFPDHNRFGEPGLDLHRPEPVHGASWQARVFAGELFGVTSPLQTRAPISGAELRLDPGTRLDVTVPEGHEHALLRVEGEVSLNETPVPVDHLAVVETGHRSLRVEAGAEPVLALLIGGEPFGEEIIMWWNFVGRTHEEIETYRSAYQAEMGFETPESDSPMSDHTEPLGAAVDGDLYDSLRHAQYPDGRPFPQFGSFPAGRPGPIPAPALPNTRLRPRQ